MKYSKKLLSIVLIVLCAVGLLSFTGAKVQAAGKTYVYYATADSLSTFKKSSGKLTLKSNHFTKTKYSSKKKFCDATWKNISKTKLSYKLSSKCKWRSLDVTDKLGAKGSKVSYKAIKANIKDVRKDDSWDFGVMIYVKNKKIIKVVEIFS